jgi:hypothetical protein
MLKNNLINVTSVMNLVLDETNYDVNSLYFYEAVKNTVMDDSSFIRIVYSNEDFILNGIYIKIDIDRNIYSKRPIRPSIKNERTLLFVDSIEKNIMRRYASNKISVGKIKDQLQYLINKIYTTNTSDVSYILKISGIWETPTSIGLTFKNIYLNPKI